MIVALLPAVVEEIFSSIDEFMQWYNCIRPHGAIELRTPIRAYYDKMPRREIIMDPSLIWSEE